MNSLLPYLPFLLSVISGHVLLSLIIGDKKTFSPLLHLSLGTGLGLGVNAYLTSLSFMLLDRYNQTCIITFNIFFLTGLLVLFLRTKNGVYSFTDSLYPNATGLRNHNNILQSVWVLYCLPLFAILRRGSIKQYGLRDTIYFITLIILFIPLFIMAKFYPYGGWDAWAVWNFKAKFLLMAGNHWNLIFDPALWRSSPHYPLLLPLINLWGWSFLDEPTYQVPMLTSLLFTFLTMGLLITGLKEWSKSHLVILSAVCFTVSPFLAKTAVSQYCDVLFGYYLLASIFCLIKARQFNNPGYGFLAGIFTGFLSFTKSEGLVAGLILTALSVFYLIGQHEPPTTFSKKTGIKDKFTMIAFAVGCALTMIPAIVFYTFLAPENITSINGLLSKTNPADFTRLKIILIFYAMELVSNKWNGLWIVLFFGLSLGWKNILKPQILIIPLFLSLYTLTVSFYYFTNTYFEIAWWLSVSLNRILGAVIPTVIFWVFYALWQDDADAKKIGK